MGLNSNKRDLKVLCSVDNKDECVATAIKPSVEDKKMQFTFVSRNALKTITITIVLFCFCFV
jgi:hypothetical protein